MLATDEWQSKEGALAAATVVMTVDEGQLLVRVLAPKAFEERLFEGGGYADDQSAVKADSRIEAQRHEVGPRAFSGGRPQGRGFKGRPIVDPPIDRSRRRAVIEGVPQRLQVPGMRYA